MFLVAIVRLLDDAFAILIQREVNTFFLHINQVFPEIKFTKEEEI